MSTSIDLGYPFTGRWLTQNSPADRMPSHGTALFASSYAIDFVPVDERGHTAPITPRTLFSAEPPTLFPGFGRPILAPVDGIVVSIADTAPDHHAYRGLPSIGYALGQRRRAAEGWTALAGNHVLIESSGFVVAVCHLKSGSVGVRPGQQIRCGDELGGCGNSGNSTEPHVHLQVIDRIDIDHAVAVPLSLRGRLPRNGEMVDA